MDHFWAVKGEKQASSAPGRLFGHRFPFWNYADVLLRSSGFIGQNIVRRGCFDDNRCCGTTENNSIYYNP